MNLYKKVLNRFLSSSNTLARYSVKVRRNYRIKKFWDRDKQIVELGGGRYPINKENLNVDVLNHYTTDIVADMLQGLPFQDNTIDKITSVALLSNFSIKDLRKILIECRRVLKQGGELEINDVALNKVFDYYQVHGCDDKVLIAINGTQRDKYDIHLCVLDSTRLMQELHQAGFIEMKELTDPIKVGDRTQETQDGVNFSMRIRCQKNTT